MPPHATHLLQALDVCVFQPLKHWHSGAVNEAVQNGTTHFQKSNSSTLSIAFVTKLLKSLQAAPYRKKLTSSLTVQR